MTTPDLARLTAAELDRYGRAAAHALNNPDPHLCVNATTCATYEQQRTEALNALLAARAEWQRRHAPRKAAA